MSDLKNMPWCIECGAENLKECTCQAQPKQPSDEELRQLVIDYHGPEEYLQDEFIERNIVMLRAALDRFSRI